MNLYVSMHDVQNNTPVAYVSTIFIYNNNMFQFK